MQFPLATGNVLAARYLVERLIGAGGMAVVAVATDLTAGQRVAIKMLLPEAARSDQVQKRFQREQRTLHKLTNEHTVKLLGTGIEASYPYMVIEYLEGTDLSDVLKMQGALPQAEAVEYVLQACESIAEAHALGITHRDIKPGNLFLTRKPNGDGCIKVLDFGISKVSEPHQPGESTLTGTTALLGSPFYMSPEQLISSRDVDARTDVWSLGVTLHELLTNTLPFGAKTTEKVCKRILNDTPDPLRRFRPDMPEGLEAALLHCLRRRPSERFANVSDWALAIADFGPPRAARQSMAAIADYLQPTRRMQLRHALPPAADLDSTTEAPEERTSALPVEPRAPVVPPPPPPHARTEPRRPPVPPAAPSEPTLPHVRAGAPAPFPSADQSYTSGAAVAAAQAVADARPEPTAGAPGPPPPAAGIASGRGGSTGGDLSTLHVERQRASDARRLVFAGIYGLGTFVLGLIVGLVVRHPTDDPRPCVAATAGADAHTAVSGPRSAPVDTEPNASESARAVDYDLDSTTARTTARPAATGSSHGQSAASGTATAAVSSVPTATSHSTATPKGSASSGKPAATGQSTSSPAVTTTPVF